MPKTRARRSAKKEIKKEVKRETEDEPVVNTKNLDSLNVGELLALGENIGQKCEKTAKIKSDDSDFNDDSSSESEWDEVATTEQLDNSVHEDGDVQNDQLQNGYTIPEEGVQITISQSNGIPRKKGKRQFDMQGYIRREMNRNLRELYVDLHKVSLLCLLARGRMLNEYLTSESLYAAAFSMLPSKSSQPPKNVNMNYLERFMTWFRNSFKVNRSVLTLMKTEEGMDSKSKFENEITFQFERKEAKDVDNLVFMFILILRSCGLQVRLVWSLQPIALKPPSENLLKKPKEIELDDSNVDSTLAEEKPSTSKSQSNKKETSTMSKGKHDKSDKKSDLKIINPKTTKNSTRGRKSKSKKDKYSSAEEDKDYSEEDDDFSDDDDFDRKKKPRKNLRKSSVKEIKMKSKRSSASSKNKTTTRRGKEDNSSSDDDGRSTATKTKKGAAGNKSTKSKCSPGSSKGSTAKAKNNRKMISSSDDEEDVKANTGNDMWPELYLEEEERWVSVEVTEGKFMCDNILEVKATKKICYVLSFGNTGNVKDVSRRYASQWMTTTQKLRIDSNWWKKSLKPFRGKRTAMDKEEDEFLDQQLLSQPFPKSIQEFKRHPLYALKRHLLKFEAIYPTEPPPLGFIKNEPVYARECVKTLHSRELWVKQAKVVRIGEKPYKIVKARPKYDRNSGMMQPCLPLELFGEWQVEDYVPPTAKDGKVPRNEYGNVELFLEKMLPKGTVHLQLPGLNRIAKKLNIDCAPALTGFEFHCGGSHPTYEGFVVCEEFVEILKDAWTQDQQEQAKKEQEKRLKRIYDNWAKLLKGLLIREKLERKYNFNLGGKRKQTEVSPVAASTSKASQGPSKKRKSELR